MIPLVIQTTEDRKRQHIGLAGGLLRLNLSMRRL